MRERTAERLTSHVAQLVSSGESRPRKTCSGVPQSLDPRRFRTTRCVLAGPAPGRLQGGGVFGLRALLIPFLPERFSLPTATA